MATYRDALDHIPELSLGDTAYNPSRTLAPTLPGSVDALASPMMASLSAGEPQVGAITQPRGIPIPTPTPVPIPTPAVVPPAATGTPTPAQIPNEAQISALVDQLDREYGIKLGLGWRDYLQRDPQAFLGYLTQIASDPGRYASVAGHPRNQPGSLDAWLQRVKAVYGPATTPAANLDAQRNAIFEEARNRLQEITASGGRSAEEELLSALGSRGLLDSGIGAKQLSDFRSGVYGNYSNALSNLNESLMRGGLDVSSQEYLSRLMSQLNLENQMALLNKQAQIQRQSQPSPWWGLAGSAIGALPFLLSPRAPGSSGLETPAGLVQATSPTNPRASTYVAPPYDPYGLGGLRP